MSLFDPCLIRSRGPSGQEAGHAQSLDLLTEPGSAFTSSLYRDLQQGDPVEPEPIIGDLAARATALRVPTPLLNAALLQMRTHHQTAARQWRKG